MANTGYKKFSNRAVYIGGVFQYNEPNTQYLPDGVTPDPNYIAPVQDLVTCPTSVTVYLRTLSATNAGTPCQTGGSFQNYYLDSNTTPQVGDVWYTDNPGTNKLNGGGNWWYYNGSATTQHRIGSDGTITAISTAC